MPLSTFDQPGDGRLEAAYYLGQKPLAARQVGQPAHFFGRQHAIAEHPRLHGEDARRTGELGDCLGQRRLVAVAKGQSGRTDQVRDQVALAQTLRRPTGHGVLGDVELGVRVA